MALLAGAPASAQDAWQNPPPAWEGVWQGTVGTHPIHLCLDTTPYRATGAYYYDRHRSLIRLEPGDGNQSWIEKGADDRPGAGWRIAAEGKEVLTGTWSSGKSSLPVRMRRIGPASADYEGPCGSMTFHRPRLRPVTLNKRSFTKDGAALTGWRFQPGAPFDNVEMSTFTLDRPGVAVARVNAVLRAVLPNPDNEGDWLDCMAGNANAHGADGEFSNSIEPNLVTRRWLAVTHRTDSYCGGNHPNSDVAFRTFDLERGAEVDPRDWLSPGAVQVEGTGAGDVLKKLTPGFRKFLLAGYKAEGEDCDGVLADQDYWTVGIENGSLVFWPRLPRVVMACSEDFKISFARLQPWLNAGGKAAVATIAAR